MLNVVNLSKEKYMHCKSFEIQNSQHSKLHWTSLSYMRRSLWIAGAYRRSYLMYGQVAHVTEEDHIAVLALPVHADATHGIFVYGRHTGIITPSALCLYMKAPSIITLKH